MTGRPVLGLVSGTTRDERRGAVVAEWVSEVADFDDQDHCHPSETRFRRCGAVFGEVIAWAGVPRPLRTRHVCTTGSASDFGVAPGTVSLSPASP